MSLSVCPSSVVCFCLSMSLFFCTSAHLSLSVYLFTCLSVCLSVFCLYAHLLTDISISVSTQPICDCPLMTLSFLSVCLSTCLSVHLLVCLSVYLWWYASVLPLLSLGLYSSFCSCLFVYLSVCLHKCLCERCVVLHRVELRAVDCLGSKNRQCSAIWWL